MDDFSLSNFLYRTCQCKSKNSYSSYTLPTNYKDPYPFFNIKTLFASFWLGVGVAYTCRATLKVVCLCFQLSLPNSHFVGALIEEGSLLECTL